MNDKNSRIFIAPMGAKVPASGETPGEGWAELGSTPDVRIQFGEAFSSMAPSLEELGKVLSTCMAKIVVGITTNDEFDRVARQINLIIEETCPDFADRARAWKQARGARRHERMMRGKHGLRRPRR